MSKNTILIVLFFFSLSSINGNTCETADDYGIINSDTLLTGTFLSEGEDYWISFTTSCEFRDITLSTCGSYGENTDQGLEYLDTILEVYSDADNGQEACDLFESWSIELGQSPNTDWWNDDPEEDSGLICDTNEEELDGEENHSVLIIPSSQEQSMGIKVQPGTYYARISGYPGHSIGGWNLYISGRATISPVVSDQELQLPHNSTDGSPGGYMQVELDASQSICTEQIVSYEWIGVDSTYGPYSSPIETVYMEYGFHQMSLLATDLSENDYEEEFSITINEPNFPPISNAGEDIVVTIPHDGDIGTEVVTVILSAELSSDGDEDELFYNWRKIEGPEDIALSNADAEGDSQDQNPTFNAFNPFGSDEKEYEFELMTTDIYGESDLDSVHVTILPEYNSSPIASSPHLNITIFHDGDPNTHNSEEFQLDGQNSSDPDGDNLVYYEWQDGQLETITESFISDLLIINYSTVDSVLGEHQFTLIVKDPYDAVDDTLIVVNIDPEPNEPPVIIFDPPLAEFICNPDDDAGCSQLVPLDGYNATYDPESDDFVSEWFDEDGNPTSSLQNLDQGQTNFTLRATDSYGDYSESVFIVLIIEPNSVPMAITLGTQEVYESTVDLDLDGVLPDTLFLYGSVVDGNHIESELGVSWSLINNNELVTILDSTSLTGSFTSDEILHNGYPLILDFVLNVWDPFSCHPMNTEFFDGEEWHPSCSIGDDPETYGVDSLRVFVENYNEAPQIYPESYDIDPWTVLEDVDTLITFDYNAWANNNFFFDGDDCVFDSLSSVCTGYLDQEFSIYIIDGEHFSSTGDTLVLEDNYYGNLSVPFQINDMNEINNLSDTLYLEVDVQSVNDAPIIISFDNADILSNGATEDSWFLINLEDITFYDIEEDVDGNGLCEELECDNIVLSAQDSENYSFSNNGTVTLTQNFFGNLELGLQITDGEDISDPYFISIPIQGINDYPNLISGMEAIYFDEDFDSTFLDLGTIFEDVDGDQMNFYLNSDPSDSLIFYSEIVDNELLMISNENLFGDQVLFFEVSDSTMEDEGTFISDSVTFFIQPINDPPYGVPGFDVTLEDTPIDLIIEAGDVDSDSLIFDIVSYPEHGTLGELVIESAFTSRIEYTPESGHRCEDSFEFVAYDLLFNGDSYDTLSVSDAVAMTIDVGECNFPPDVSVGLNINVFEDNAIFFINTDLLNSELADNYFSLDNEFNFTITDEDSTSSPFIELWEGENYYIESGYCAYPTLLNHWDVDTEKNCGLIPSYADCEIGLQVIETNYNDGSKYCACSSDQTCTASEFYLDTLSIRPTQDFDSTFNIITIANDGNLLYNLSDTSFTTVYMSGINDTPSIGAIENQTIDEGESLHLGYIYSQNEEGIDSTHFTIYDVDNASSEISFNLHSNDIYYQTNPNDSTLVVNLFNPDWNGLTEVMVTLQDQDFLTYTTSFNLNVNQVDDPPNFQTIGVGDQQGEPLTLLEDTTPGAFDQEIRIYYNDPDWDPSINDNPDDAIYAEILDWEILPFYGEESKVDFILLDSPGADINDNNELYYYQWITLNHLDDNWNGYDGVYFINNEDTLSLGVHVTQQNDAPDSFDIDNELITQYNQNQYSWTADEANICSDEDLAQGSFNNQLSICTIPNFFRLNVYTCDSTLGSYESESLCDENCTDGDCEVSYGDMYYRLPYRRLPAIDLVQSDSLLFRWGSAYDIDLDLDFSQDLENDIELFYRVELVDQLAGRTHVISDSIPADIFSDEFPEQKNLLDKSFFSYNTNLNYFDHCGIFSNELTLSDTSHQYLDLTGNTKYSWRVAAHNLWCDEEGLDPSSITLGESTETDFYIDLIPPIGSISVFQNEVSPEFMKLYIAFDESIDTWKSEIFITYNSETISKNFPDDVASNIYDITELFPGTGVIDIEIESWDAVGNGTLSTTSLTYEELMSSTGKTIYSPSGSLDMKFDEDDIENDASLLIKEQQSPINQNLRSEFHRVSPIYEISSVNMNIIDEVEVKIQIPESYYNLEHWKFKIFRISDGLIINDITTWSNTGVVTGQLSELGQLALYYDSAAEFEIPSDINLVGNYPNPINPSTNIFYFVQGNYDPVSIKILDLRGREVKVLYNGFNSRGYYEIDWDGTNQTGHELGSGIYFIDAHIGSKHSYKKIMKLK